MVCRHKKSLGEMRSGMVLIISMLFIVIFSVFAVSMASMAGTNVQMASNQRKGNKAFLNAASGMEITRYILANVQNVQKGSTSGETIGSLYTAMQSLVSDQEMSGVTVIYNGSGPIQVRSTNCMFSSQISSVDDSTIQLSTTGYGSSGSAIRKTVGCRFTIETGTAGAANPIFGYGIATKGNIEVSGAAKVLSINSDPNESDVYVDASGDTKSLTMSGSGCVIGEVSIVNPSTDAVSLTGCITIGGESIPTWWDTKWGGPFDDDDINILNKCHVYPGMPPQDFPVPDPESFKHYVTGSTPISGVVSGGPYTLTNPHITGDTELTGNYTINGVIYIEPGCKVVFSGSVIINGMIVAAGDYQNPLSGDEIEFRGHVTCNGVENLPSGSQFDALREEKGTSILAPGFRLKIGCTFDSLNGSIVGSGISFTGNPQVTVGGTVINYDQSKPLKLCNSTCLRFDHSNVDMTKNPAGFEQTSGSSSETTFSYVADSYYEN